MPFGLETTADVDLVTKKSKYNPSKNKSDSQFDSHLLSSTEGEAGDEE